MCSMLAKRFSSSLGELKKMCSREDDTSMIDIEEEDIDIATCPGCGSYGVFDSVCIRRFDGELEECGVRG